MIFNARAYEILHPVQRRLRRFPARFGLIPAQRSFQWLPNTHVPGPAVAHFSIERLPISVPTFRVVFDLDFCSGCDPGFACFTVFPVIGMLARTRFWSILDPTFTRVSQYFKIRVSILPYLNSFPDTLPIRNKNPYPLLFRFFKKQINPEKWPAGTPRYLSLEQFCPLLGLR